MFLLSRSFFLPLSLSLSFCFSFFRLTISISTCLSLSSLSFCFAKRRNRWWNDGGIVNNHRLQNHVHPCFLIPFLSPRFEKFRLSKHTPVVVVTERCVPYYLRNSTVLLLLLSEVHVVLKRISFHPLLGSKPFSVKVNVNVVTELRWRIRKKKRKEKIIPRDNISGHGYRFRRVYTSAVLGKHVECSENMSVRLLPFHVRYVFLYASFLFQFRLNI